MKLSVIIPVYNVESTLRRCVESVLQQDAGSMEIILVNDGSTDSSASIATELARQHGRVRLIVQENRGLSAARNAGLDTSTGDLITFVDSDDWLRPDTYKPLLSLLSRRPDCGILEYSLEKRRSDGSLDSISFVEKEYLSPEDYWLSGRAYSHTYACNKIFRRGVFFPEDGAPVRFPEGRVFEDMTALSLLLERKPLVLTTHFGGYVYEYNPSGITVKAGGEELSQLLGAHLGAAARLGLPLATGAAGGSKWLDDRFSALYLAMLNVQLSVCKASKRSPRMPYFKVRLRSLPQRPAVWLKVMAQNLFGLDALCRIYALL